MTGPLAGVRVVVLAGMGPVPFTAMLLADMGAQVVRVARPTSRPARALSQVDGLREEHDLVNRGVVTVTLDLKDPDGIEQVLRLASAADVFVEGYRPGVTERLGLAPDTYQCADGRYIAVGALEPDFYREFVSRLGVDVAVWPDHDDRAAWPRLRELIAAAVAARPQAEWARVYEGTDACVTPVLTFDEAARHPHNAERGVFARIGGVLHPSPAPRFSRTPARSPAAPHTGPVDVHELIETWCPEEVAHG